MLVTLKKLLGQYLEKDAMVGAFNITCYYDAKPVILAGEKRNAPVIIAVGPSATKVMDLGLWGKLLLEMAERSKVPVCVHLDHGHRFEEVKAAIDAGFPSVMIDGSQLSYEDNVAITQKVVEYARPRGVSVEAEIGSVAYDGNASYKSILTDPDIAARFVADTKIDAVAVAVGTLHAMNTQAAHIEFDLLDQIQAKVDIPLVIHGASGLLDKEFERLRATHVSKLNIGTALRRTFNGSLRKALDDNPESIYLTDLIHIPMQAVEDILITKLKLLGF